MIRPAAKERIASNPASFPLPNTMGMGPMSTKPPTLALPPVKEPNTIMAKPRNRRTTPTAYNLGWNISDHVQVDHEGHENQEEGQNDCHACPFHVRAEDKGNRTYHHHSSAPDSSLGARLGGG